MVINPSGDLCLCGGRGCLELYAGFKGVLRQAARVHGSEISITEVVGLAQSGNVGYRRLIADAGDAAGQGLALIGAALNRPLIVIGGRGALAGELILAPLRAAYERFALIKNSEVPEAQTRIIPGAFLTNDSGLAPLGSCFAITDAVSG